MAAADRELTITYGGFTVGGVVGTDAGYHLHDFHGVETGAETASVRFEVVVTADSAASFGARCKAIEAAFSRPFQNLTVSQAGTVLRHFSHDTNSGGFDAQPSIVKSGTEGVDSGRSRQYTVNIEFGVPASLYPTSGLRSREITLEVPANRRRVVRIAGVYTAVSGSSARTKYNAGISAMASSILSSLGITESELIEETAGPDNQTDKVIEFERVYQELVFSQAGATLDDTDIKEQSLRITTDVVAPGDSLKAPANSGGGFVEPGRTGTGNTTGTVARLAEQRLEYQATIDSSQSTDLRAKYTSIKPWLLQQMKSDAGDVAAFALVSDAPEYDHDENILRVSMRALVATRGQTVYLREITVVDRVDEGRQHDEVWNGTPNAVYRYQGPSRIERTVTERRICQGSKNTQVAGQLASSLARGQSGLAFSSSTSGGQWDEITRDASVTPRTLGYGGDTIDTTEIVASVTMRLIVVVGSTGGGGGSPRPITPGATPTFGGGVVTTPSGGIPGR